VIKRIILMLALAAFLVVALSVSGLSAFAKSCGHQGNGHPQCNQAGGGGGGPNKPPGQTNNPNPGK
jgi:hypothetical protein